MTSRDSLRINEIFLSLQGESRSSGWPTVFVRLTGCPLRCRWCDTAYAFHDGERLSVDEIVRRVADYDVRHVTVTGGEPLAQPACLPLLSRLADGGFLVSLETSGAMDIAEVDERVIQVMDLKPPSSGETTRNRYANLERLTARDQVKFVIGDRGDYLWSRDILNQYRLADRCEVLFSPVAGELEPRRLAEWVLEDRLPVRFQIQLHKLLWGDRPGH
ncbi:7-carboxy-7-deazaguanine synthase QueE [Methylohalobius crimeensis]|uniref:7-carboxy-7-deazaguanine synthase QueE n=1 Tax=Methylohalobius crimeensis TaxID=244365 RepID=UPI0003B716D2|nr:7-carboxy-7-deazaguanine synthase QueE [Methylohalobius crimeensis]